MKPGIVITRTMPDADALADRLAALGYEPILEPMLHVRSTFAPCPHDPICADGVIITSAQALRHLLSSVVKSVLQNKYIYAVGSKTAELARAQGWPHVFDGGGDVKKLGSFLKSRPEINQASRLIHVCGRDIAADTHDILKTVPGQIWNWIVYEADPAQSFSPAFKERLTTGHAQGVLFYSTRAAQVFSTCVQTYERPEIFKGMIFLCLASGMVKSLESLDCAGMYVSEVPEESSLLTLLNTHIPAR